MKQSQTMKVHSKRGRRSEERKKRKEERKARREERSKERFISSFFLLPFRRPFMASVVPR
jgi:hypothetical protein